MIKKAGHILLFLLGVFLLFLFTAEGDAGFPRQIIDDFGQKVIISKKPERIVSLAPANTEILFAIGAGSKLVGVTTYCDFPPEAKEIDKIGGYTTPDIETIVAKNPDLVFAAYGNGEENIEKLRELGIAVVSLYPRSLEDVLKDIVMVGQATGFEDKAEGLVLNLRKRIKVVEEKSRKIPQEKRPWILWIMWYPELWTAGTGTFFDELVKIAGGRNVAFDLQGWKVISKETVLMRDPDIIVCSQMGTTGELLLEKMKGDPEFKKMQVIKEGQIYVIEQDLLELPGPRIVEGLERIDEYITDFWKEGTKNDQNKRCDR